MCVPVWICVYTRVSTCAFKFLHVYIHVRVCVYACAYVCMCTCVSTCVHVCCCLNAKCLHQFQVLNFWSPTGGWNFRSWGLAGKYRFRGEAYNVILVPTSRHSLSLLSMVRSAVSTVYFHSRDALLFHEPRTMDWKVWRIEPK